MYYEVIPTRVFREDSGFLTYSSDLKLVPGTIIEIPEGAKHWHGAAADSWMQHLTYHANTQPGNSNEWLEPVDDKQYGELK